MLTPEDIKVGDDLYVRFDSGWVRGDVTFTFPQNDAIDFATYEKGYVYAARLTYQQGQARWVWSIDTDDNYVVDVAASADRDLQTARVAAEIGSQEWADELLGWTLTGGLAHEIFLADLIRIMRKPVT